MDIIMMTIRVTGMVVTHRVTESSIANMDIMMTDTDTLITDAMTLVRSHHLH
jgi:hypothetical protein